MSLWSILLRALLSLSLILNGVATAGAATHRHANPADMQSVIAAPVKVSQAGEKVPCHQHQQADSAAMNDQPPLPAEHASKPDCCKSSTCGCACMHATQATLPGLNLAAPLLDHSRSVRQLTLAHASPALPHLLRPPIGQVS